VICYDDAPKEFESSKKINLAGKEKPLSIALSELSREL